MPLGYVASAVGIASGVKGLLSGGGGPTGVSSQQSDIQRQQAQEQSTVFGEQQGFEKQLAALMADPSSVTKLPGYDFNKQQGEQSLERQMGAAGFLGSGNLGAGLIKYGQDYASNTFNQQVQLLMAMSGIGSLPGVSGVNPVGGSANSSNAWNNFAGQMGTLAGLWQSGGVGGSAGGGTSSIWDSGSSGGSSPWYLNPWYSGGSTFTPSGGGGGNIIANTGGGTGWG